MLSRIQFDLEKKFFLGINSKLRPKYCLGLAAFAEVEELVEPMEILHVRQR
jgi:hypothetical protein